MTWLLRTVIIAIVAGLAARGVVSIVHDGWSPDWLTGDRMAAAMGVPRPLFTVTSTQ